MLRGFCYTMWIRVSNLALEPSAKTRKMNARKKAREQMKDGMRIHSPVAEDSPMPGSH